MLDNKMDGSLIEESGLMLVAYLVHVNETNLKICESFNP